MAQSNFQKIIFEEFKAYFEPLEIAGASADNILHFFHFMGWDMHTILGGNTSAFVNKIADIINGVSVIENAIQDPPDTFDEIADTLAGFIAIITNIRDLATIANTVNAPAEISDLPKDVLEALSLLYLRNRRPQLYSIFEFIGIIYEEPQDLITKNDVIVKFKGQIPRFDLSKLGDFLKDPIPYLKNRYLTSFATLSSTSATGNFLFSYIEKILNRYDISTLVGRGAPPIPLIPVNNEQIKLDGMLTASKSLDIDSSGNSVQVGATIGLLSIPENGPGVFIIPFGTFNFSKELGDWDVSLQINSNIPGFEINKDGIQIYDTTGKIDVGINLSVERISDNGVAYVIGSINGTHLSVGSIKITGLLDVLDKDYTADISLQIKDAQFILKAGDGDSFLKKILPENGLKAEFELIIGYNNKRGLYFLGGAGLEVRIPLHKSLFGIEFEDLLLSVFVKSDGTIPIAAATSFSLNIGPILVSVQNVGLRANLSFPSNGGNLGPLDLNLGFKPPTGVGISIDADPVSGGGFLNFDESTSTYTGGLELNFSKISLKAIGILTTKMPDGGDGFSLLIIITAEFTPIQLGMGFTLNGVGGLLGWNRTMNTDRLRTGIKDNTLDSILFPQDIVKNANVIISNIGQAFPVKRDRFIIGPMAKLGWGTPTLITIEIGVLIEVPTPVVIAIVGVIKALLPSDNNRIIAIQVNFLGVIDFGKKYLSFDASLFDSKILFFSLYGDMALRVYWGDKPNFLLSVGGFHPKFTPPPMNLPQMQRLAIELANSNNLKIRIETYFAVTSNSAQFGARLEARAKAWKIEAIGALWFDILFQFSPFYFNANMGAMFAIKMGSRELLSIYLELNLEGPNPWKAQGRASFKVLGVRVNVSFDKTFGQVRVEPIEMAELWGKFNDAVLNKDSWEVIGPDRSHQTVAFREVPDGNTDLVIDPFGALRFNQKLVPMNISLSKYGTAKIKDVNKFQVTSLVLTDADNNTQTITPTITQDYFARNEFFYMTDDEKLSKESYERFDSGFSIGSTDEIYVSAYTNRVCAYEDITIDTRPDWRFRLVAANAIDLDIAMFDRHVSNNYVSEAKLSNSSAMVIADGPQSTKVLQEEYFVMNRNTMQKVQGYNLDDKYDNAAAADIALGAARNGWPADAANFIVVNSFELQSI